MSDSYDPMDCSLPRSSVHGISQARILKWVPFPSPWDLPNPGIKPGYPALQADSLPTETPGTPICGHFFFFFTKSNSQKVGIECGCQELRKRRKWREGGRRVQSFNNSWLNSEAAVTAWWLQVIILIVYWNLLRQWIMGLFSQYLHMSNHHAVHFKYIMI